MVGAGWKCELDMGGAVFGMTLSAACQEGGASKVGGAIGDTEGGGMLLYVWGVFTQDSVSTVCKYFITFSQMKRI